MKRNSTTAIASPPVGGSAVGEAWDEVSTSFDRFCLAAGIEALGTMMERDAEEACGRRHARGVGRRGHRWGRTQGKIGFHGGRAVAEDWLGRWAMNLMLINVSTRKMRRAMRLPEG